MKIAILTMFNGLTNTYSLVNVVESHVKMLLKADMDVSVFVSETCPDSDRYGIFKDARIHWVKVKNILNGHQINWYDYSSPTGILHESFNIEAEAIALDLTEKLKDMDICMMHDILYQGWHYIHNIAIRMAQKALPGLRFLSFTHSLPAERPKIIDKDFYGRYQHMANTLYIYPTQSGIPALAKQYDVPEGLCRAVYHPVPVIEHMSDDIKFLHSQINLFEPEILIAYPARLTKGKQFEKIAELAGCIATFCAKSVKIIYCDFPSMDTNATDYKAYIQEMGMKYGLEKECMVFTSDLGYPDGFPRTGVFDLFSLTNLFICPSYSESFGLTVLEAASKGNFIVLNEAVPALSELGNKINAYFMRWDAKNFGFDTIEHYNPSVLSYYRDHGEIITRLMEENPVLQAKTTVRTKFNADWIWRHQMFPLLLTKLESCENSQ